MLQEYEIDHDFLPHYFKKVISVLAGSCWTCKEKWGQLEAASWLVMASAAHAAQNRTTSSLADVGSSL